MAALSALAQQPDASGTITRTSLCRSGHDRVTGDLLLRYFDDSDLCESVLEFGSGNNRRISMLVDWFTTVCSDHQLPHPGVAVEALSVQTDSSRDGRARTANGECAQTKPKNKRATQKTERQVFEKKAQELAEEKERVLKNVTEEAEEERKRMYFRCPRRGYPA